MRYFDFNAILPREIVTALSPSARIDSGVRHSVVLGFSPTGCWISGTSPQKKTQKKLAKISASNKPLGQPHTTRKRVLTR